MNETDLSKLEHLLKTFEIAFEKNEEHNGSTTVIIDEGSCEKVEGYNGFYTIFHFNQDGKFTSMGAYE